MIRCQSLIGRVATPRGGLQEPGQTMCQSLIGRVATKIANGKEHRI